MWNAAKEIKAQPPYQTIGLVENVSDPFRYSLWLVELYPYLPLLLSELTALGRGREPISGRQSRLFLNFTQGKASGKSRTAFMNNMGKLHSSTKEG